MRIAQIAVLGIAIAAAGGAGILMYSATKPLPAPTPIVERQKPALEVLVAGVDLSVGRNVKPEELRWQPWPNDAPSLGLIKRNENPNMTQELAGSIVRTPIYNGEPIRREKLVKGNGFMSAVLPAGMRAVAISIDTRGASSAGGFILPNDRVDLIQTGRPGASDDGAKGTQSETILHNVRVLAIGQNIQERNGEKVVTGETATLELTPAQAELVVLAQKVGQLSLALRSIADANDTGPPVRERTNNRLEIIRFGESQQASVK